MLALPFEQGEVAFEAGALGGEFGEVLVDVGEAAAEQGEQEAAIERGVALAGEVALHVGQAKAVELGELDHAQHLGGVGVVVLIAVFAPRVVGPFFRNTGSYRWKSRFVSPVVRPSWVELTAV